MWIDTPIGKAHIPLDLSWSYITKIPDTQFHDFFDSVQQLEALVAGAAGAPVFSDLIMQREASTFSPQWAGQHHSHPAYATSPFVPFHVFDSFESLNYAHAMQFALSRAKTHPLSLHHLCTIHKRLLPSQSGVGKVRRGNVWIGPHNTTAREAKIILPPANVVRPAMAALRRFYDLVPNECRLQSAALIHLQFISIHPFFDGNGRMVRLLTAVLLSRLKITSGRVLLISNELREADALYRTCLERAEQHGKIDDWVHFMVDVFTRQARSTAMFLQRVAALRGELIAGLDDYVSLRTAAKIADYLLLCPTFSRSALQEFTNTSEVFVAKLLEQMSGWKGLSLVSPTADPIYQIDDVMLALGR